MKTVSKVTTVYNHAQDRISMSGEISDGSTAILWITRRLVERLVPELLAWLKTTDKEADLPRSDVINSFKQQSAAGKLPQSGPVVAEKPEAEWLVTAVDVQKRPEIMRLVFRAPDQHQEKIALDLAPLALRQWLNILLAGYQRAEWPLDVWPEWMREQLPDQQRPESVPLH
ncbi:MAG: hypothetical protein ACI87W_000787 [Halieaceae bacterium]|jgi:hypothetical protein